MLTEVQMHWVQIIQTMFLEDLFTIRSLIDVFRIFDALNWIENMKVLLMKLNLEKFVKLQFVIQVICSPSEKNTLDYYLKMAENLKKWSTF